MARSVSISRGLCQHVYQSPILIGSDPMPTQVVSSCRDPSWGTIARWVVMNEVEGNLINDSASQTFISSVVIK